MPYEQTLALAVHSSKFPDISVQVTREATQSGPSGSVFSGLFPWAGQSLNPATHNPFQLGVPYLVANTQSTNGGTGKLAYSSGEHAVKNIESQTKQNPEVAKSIRNKGGLASGAPAAIAAVPQPTCDLDTLVANGVETICWKFNDWRP